MAGTWAKWLAGVVVVAGVLWTSPAQAGPFLGEWGWCWNPSPSCPPSLYPRLHYWCVGAYKVRAWVHPSYLDQYPAGPVSAPPAPILFNPSACRSIPPVPSTPYADPAAYFGRSMGPAPTSR